MVQQAESYKVLSGRIKLPYQWTVGATGSKFFTELRDHKKIWGTKCPECKKVFVPPRKTCGTCFVDMGEWVELRPTGRLETFTVVHYHEPALHGMEPPFVYGIIKLDGADTGIAHYIGEVKDLESVKSGSRVEAVFREQREGSILDIKYFRLIG